MPLSRQRQSLEESCCRMQLDKTCIKTQEGRREPWPTINVLSYLLNSLAFCLTKNTCSRWLINFKNRIINLTVKKLTCIKYSWKLYTPESYLFLLLFNQPKRNLIQIITLLKKDYMVDWQLTPSISIFFKCFKISKFTKTVSGSFMEIFLNT